MVQRCGAGATVQRLGKVARARNGPAVSSGAQVRGWVHAPACPRLHTRENV